MATASFFSEIDTVIVGRQTYEEDCKLAAEWTTSKRIYLLTTQKEYSLITENTQILEQLDLQAVERIRAEAQRDIWVVGGGPVITELLNLGAVDEMRLFIVPTAIGSGIRLFPDNRQDLQFSLSKVEHFPTGMVSLTYQPLLRDT